ncbi:phosphoglycerate mutase-like protein [Wilcoxina mikolae CBS 423.85]|nr:phosphoglycerate mutase-like protein [Wilcoxina mikolae CBS 423.85]
MSTFQPPPSYTAQQLAALYPSTLELRQVQVIFRHGERTQVSSRFQNAGVPPFWPYCNVASRFTAAVLGPGNTWDTLSFQRRLETFGKNGEAILGAGPGAVVDNICTPGELTDRGRETTLALGTRLRKLYVDQLRFLPPSLGHQNEYYLRATPVVRALESLQQVFIGLYPAPFRDPSAFPIMHTRSPAEENLFPNESNCRRFAQLARAFAKAAEEKWNDSPEMDHLQQKIGNWMPPGERVKVDGHPRLSGVYDSVNTTLAHGPQTRLPDEFYEDEVRRILNDINVDEWFRGYKESSEFRRLGVGSLLQDVKTRIVAVTKGESNIKLALMGCHDTTIAGILATLGSFDDQWPPFTSSIAIETFRTKSPRQSFWQKIVGGNKDEGWYVRMRYNEKPMVIAGCRKEGKHLQGDQTLCTMAAFKETIEKIAPKDWKKECHANLDVTGLPKVEEVK